MSHTPERLGSLSATIRIPYDTASYLPSLAPACPPARVHAQASIRLSPFVRRRRHAAYAVPDLPHGRS
ncbi:hypothetical protein CGRA01v4_02577 [Colletotrichum graminicola]|nr:hypothetical protein CGRA01v4_02577 [Colletotrichum graminicola]